MRRTKEQKAITLIALIITIVVLLILAVVAISSIQNDGILSYAQNAANNYNQAVTNEQSTIQGYLNFLQNGGLGNATDPDLEFLKRYVLGEEGTGRSLTEMFLDDESTADVDESALVTYLNDGTNENENMTKRYIYFKYNNKAYKIVADYNAMITESVELIYVPEGREGQKVTYDSNLDGTSEEWIIITDRAGKVEIVSAEAMGSLALGFGDTRVNVTADLDGDGTIGDSEEKAKFSYNNAITTINNYCDELVTATNNGGVRSVGGTNNNSTPYHSTKYDNLGLAIKPELVSGDIQYEEDLVKMNYYGIATTTKGYWLASRVVFENSGGVGFYARNVYGGRLSKEYLWYVNNDGSVGGGSPSYAVRPVVINPEGI